MHFIQITLYLTLALHLNNVNGQTNSKFQYATSAEKGTETDDVQHYIVYPNSAEDGNAPNSNVNKNVGNVLPQIPIELLEEINKMTNITEFFEKFVIKESMDPKDVVVPRFGALIEKSREVNAVHAGCKPENKVVPLRPGRPYKAGTIIFPSCTRVKRCSGCCLRPDVLSCQPSEKELIPFRVTVNEYVGGRGFNYVGKELILIEEHKKCKCACKKQESDCNIRQRYDAPKCKCICTNVDDEKKCSKSVGKVWDEEQCLCRCLEIQDCPVGQYFNENLCQCIQISQIPLELLDKVNKISNISDFFERFVNKESIGPSDDVVPTYGVGMERGREVNAVHAGCKPENEVVPLRPDRPYKAGTIIFPSCTRVKRCGGCCLRPDVLSCQPTETELIPFRVTVNEYGGENGFTYVGKELILVEEHKKCKCACKKQESDCNIRQRYDVPKCKCICTNINEENKCSRSGGKFWDEEQCLCRCLESQDCPAGQYFNENLCQCIQMYFPPRFQNNPIPTPNRTTYYLKPIPVSPDTRYHTDKK